MAQRRSNQQGLPPEDEPLTLPDLERISDDLAQVQSAPALCLDLAELHHRDLGNAEALVALYGDRLRYDWRQGRWLIWQEHHWVPDMDGHMGRVANSVARARMKAAADIDDKAARKAAYKWALRSEDRPRLAAMVALARNLKPIATAGAEFDAAPWLLGVSNGVVDLRTGTLQSGRPGDNITKSTGIVFDPRAEAPRWRKFLREIFDDDLDLVAYVRRAVGYCLTADCREECLFLLWGGGFNGKTVLLNILRALNGDYAANTPFSTFEATRYHTIPNDLAALVGKRLVTASETAEARRLNEARIKALTGRDPITCRFMRQEWFTYTPVFKVWLAMNNKPAIRGTDEGIWRRIRLIPFTVSFKGRADLTLEHKLKRELPGILAWGVRGCLDCQRNGLQEPDAVLAATEAYRTESDVLDRFLADCTIAGDGLMVRTGTLYQAYIDWCKETGEKPLGGRWFGRKLSERGVDRFRDKKARYYVGLGLPADESNG